jgi:hypothetical protein
VRGKGRFDVDIGQSIKTSALVLAVLACAVLGVAVGDSVGHSLGSLVEGEGHHYCYTVTDERGGTYRTDSPVQAMEVVAGMPAARWEDGGKVVYLFRPLSVTYDVDLCESGQRIEAVEAQR